GSGSRSLQSSRNAVRRSGSRPATCAPDGATPSVDGSHQSSNVACSTSTATALSTMSPRPHPANQPPACPQLRVRGGPTSGSAPYFVVRQDDNGREENEQRRPRR